jgi:hypothetical protein
MTNTVTVAATVEQVGIDPELRDRLRRHLVRLRVDRVLAGDPPGDRLTLLIHSPSKAFADPDPQGSSFIVTLTEPVTDPYTGPLEITDVE